MFWTLPSFQPLLWRLWEFISADLGRFAPILHPNRNNHPGLSVQGYISPLGKLALKLVFLLIACTSLLGVVFVGSYSAHADFVFASALAFVTPFTLIIAAATAASHELQTMPST